MTNYHDDLAYSVANADEPGELTQEQLDAVKAKMEEVEEAEYQKQLHATYAKKARMGSDDLSLAPGFQETIGRAIQQFRVHADANVPGPFGHQEREANNKLMDYTIRPKLRDGERLTKAEMELVNDTEFEMGLAEFFNLSSIPKELTKYRVHQTGIHGMLEQEAAEAHVCQFFTVVGNGECPMGRGATLVIRYLDRRGAERTLTIPKSIIYDRPGRLASYVAESDFRLGVSVSHEKITKRFKLLLELVMAHAPSVDVVDELGWVEGPGGWGFVLPEDVIGNPSSAAQAENSVRTIIDRSRFTETSVSQRGGFEKWKSQVARYSVGNSRLTLALCAAFTSPLLRFSPDVETGVIHLFGDTSTGKTTTLRVAGSVWGGSRTNKLGYAHTWNTTDKALLHKAASYSETLFCLDEFKLATPNVIQAVYDLSSGEERGRLNQNGTARRSRKFRVMTLSTGELTFEEKLRSNRFKGQKEVYGGSGVRFLDMPACPESGLGIFDDLKGYGSGAELSEHLKDASARHYGHAGPAFIDFLIDQIEDQGEEKFCDDLADDVRDFVELLDLPPETADELRRIAKTFGLLAAAGKLAVDAKLLPHSTDQIDEALMACFDDYVKLRGGYGKKVGTSALVMLRDYLQKNRHRFADVADNDHQTNDLAGYYRPSRKSDGDWYYFLPAVWRDEVESVAPRAGLAEKLLTMGLLQRSSASAKSGTFQDVLSVGGQKLRVYRVSAKVLELTDDGEVPDDNDEDEDRAHFNAGGKAIDGEAVGSEVNSVDAVVIAMPKPKRR